MQVEFRNNQLDPCNVVAVAGINSALKLVAWRQKGNFSSPKLAFVTLMTLLWQYICTHTILTQWETNQDRPRNSHPSLPSKETIKHLFQYTRKKTEWLKEEQEEVYIPTLQGSRRWVARVGNCPPRFQQISFTYLNQRGQIVLPHSTTCPPSFRQFPTPLLLHS